MVLPYCHTDPDPAVTQHTPGRPARRRPDPVAGGRPPNEGIRAMARRRRLSSALLPMGLAGLLLGAAACGGGSSGGAAAAAPDTGLDSKSTQELATQATQEGSLTWYTTFADDDVQPI